MSSESPPYLIEVSWETANMVGGIHTVLATKSGAMAAHYGERYLLIGPDLWKDSPDPPAFAPEEIFPGLSGRVAHTLGLGLRQGRWKVPGNPICLLVDFSGLYGQKDAVLGRLWEDYRVDSLFGGWDYLEPVLFGHAAGQAIELLVTEYLLPQQPEGIVAQFHEWMVCSGMLYLRRMMPEIGTVFTTHATVLGRSLCGSGRSLSEAYHLDTSEIAHLARDLGVPAKHSIESTSARQADCFTTVSQTTAEEAAQLLSREPDLVLPNGLGDDFPPPAHAQPEAVEQARASLLALAEATIGRPFDPKRTTLVMGSGRLEFLNKGIDLVLDALAELRNEPLPDGGTLLCFMLYPAGHTGPNRQVLGALRGEGAVAEPMCATHDLADPEGDPILRRMAHHGLCNQPQDAVQLIYVPIYMDGRDPLVSLSYLQALPAFDLTLFPSFYEPWGYTPMESIGYGVPTVTSDLAGFGRWAAEMGDWEQTGVHVLARKDREYDDALAELVDLLRAFLARDQTETLRRHALALADRANWSHFGQHYLEAHRQALARARERLRGTSRPMHAGTSALALAVAREGVGAPNLRHFNVVAELPSELSRLRELAYNVWWSWDADTEALFERLDPQVWQRGGNNPVYLLETVSPQAYQRALEDPAYMGQYRESLARFDAYRQSSADPRIAYFCAEFGLAECLPFYAGGMGILAGDHLKAASDLGLPLVGVGLAYRCGYFRQKIDADGNQQASSPPSDFSILPVLPVMNDDGTRTKVSVGFPGRAVYLQVWRVNVGSIALYLLDSDVPENAQADREITSQLYGGGTENRLKQELLLGIGGLLLLQALELQIRAYHMNEGHSAFLVLARMGQLVRNHQLKFEEALTYVRSTMLFTTHTPVPAGHDAFAEELMRPYFHQYCEILHISWEQLLAMGHWPGSDHGQPFSMTLLALRGSSRVNAVSKIHGEISRGMFSGLFPGFQRAEVPVSHITNGIHTRTWIAPAIRPLLAEHLDNAQLTQDADVPLDGLQDEALWTAHQQSKQQLLTHLRSRLRETWQGPPHLLERVLDGLREERLLVTWARRFAPYKRATMLLDDMDALAELGDVTLLFAGKAHPADHLGQNLLRRVHEISRDERFIGRVILLEDYDIELARLLVRGSDVWLNTPTRPLEASGTSGMKAAINGVLNLSVPDGWWAEVVDGSNGWAIGEAYDPACVELQNAGDRQALMTLLRDLVLPTYQQRDAEGLPRHWLAMMRSSIATTLSRYSSLRMTNQYYERFYSPLIASAERLSSNGFAALTERVLNSNKLARAWTGLRIESAAVSNLADEKLPLGEPLIVTVRVHHPDLSAEDLLVQVVSGMSDGTNEIDAPSITSLEHTSDGVWRGHFVPDQSGPHCYGIRVAPRHPERPDEINMALRLVTWV